MIGLRLCVHRVPCVCESPVSIVFLVLIGEFCVCVLVFCEFFVSIVLLVQCGHTDL